MINITVKRKRRWFKQLQIVKFLPFKISYSLTISVEKITFYILWKIKT